MAGVWPINHYEKSAADAPKRIVLIVEFYDDGRATLCDIVSSELLCV